MRGIRGITLVLLATAVAATPAAAVVCTGDCDNDGMVRIGEIVSGVAMALGEAPPELCTGFAEPVRIDSLIRATANALSDCGPEGPYVGPPASLQFAGVTRQDAKRIGDLAEVALSPDGRHAYVASQAGISWFARDRDSGQLALLGSVPGVEAAGAVVLSPDGRALYAITFAPTDHFDRRLAVAVYRRDVESGALALLQTVAADSNLAHLAMRRDGTALYAAAYQNVFGADDVALSAFRRESDGRLQRTDSMTWRTLALSTVWALTVDGNHLYAAGDGLDPNRHRGRLLELGEDAGVLRVERLYDDDLLGVWWIHDVEATAADALYLAGLESVDSDESREVVVHLARPGADAPLAVVARTPIDERVEPNRLALSPDDRQLAIAGYGTLGLYTVAEDGALSLRGVATNPGGFYIGGASVFADAAQLYGATHVYDGITLYRTAPELTRLETWRGSVGGIEGIADVRRLVDSADATTLYATGDEHTLAVFARDAASGALAQRQVLRTQEDGAPYMYGINDGNLAVSPDDRNLYATIHSGESVASFTRVGDGTLLPLDELSDIARDGYAEEFPYGLAISPDGLTVYASGYSDVDGRDFVAVLPRDPVSGTLRWDGGLRDSGGTLACSADGMNVYGTAEGLMAWSRGTDGRLMSLGFTTGADGDVLALSPDGQHAYLAAPERSTVSVFARAADGRLTYLADADSGLRGVDGLAVRADGRAVYAVSSADSSLSVLARYGGGYLLWRERHRDGSGADGLAGAAAVLASRDGRTVYVAGAGESAIAAFRVTGDPLLPNGAPCDEEFTCASAICDFSLDAFGGSDGGPAGPVFPKVCCERLCYLDEACDNEGVCRKRHIPEG